MTRLCRIRLLARFHKSFSSPRTTFIKTYCNPPEPVKLPISCIRIQPADKGGREYWARRGKEKKSSILVSLVPRVLLYAFSEGPYWVWPPMRLFPNPVPLGLLPGALIARDRIRTFARRLTGGSAITESLYSANIKSCSLVPCKFDFFYLTFKHLLKSAMKQASLYIFTKEARIALWSYSQYSSKSHMYSIIVWSWYNVKGFWSQKNKLKLGYCSIFLNECIPC